MWSPEVESSASLRLATGCLVSHDSVRSVLLRPSIFDSHIGPFHGSHFNFSAPPQVLRLPLVETADKFEYRELQFRASKAVNATILGKDAISSASVASNETHVILYGGYLGNTRTSAVHTYTLSVYAHASGHAKHTHVRLSYVMG